MSEVIETQELELREKVISPVVSHADAINVTNAEQYQGASLLLKEVKTAMERVDVELIEPAKEAKRKAEKNRKNLVDIFRAPLEKAEGIIKSKMLMYKSEEELKRIAEERRLQAEADERARKEREKLLKHASKLKTPERQEEYRQMAEEVEVPVVTVPSKVPEIKGQSFRKIWKGRVIDKAAFLEFVVNNPHFLHMIDVNQKELNNFASSSKGEVVLLGIEFYEDEIMASGGK
jgi:hypothetical protein